MGGYYAVLSADVRYAKIANGAKLLYAEITALSNKKGYCWASNGYFAKLYGVDVRTIKRWLAHLSSCGFIFISGSTSKRSIALGTKMSPTRDKNVPHNTKGILNKGLAGKASTHKMYHPEPEEPPTIKEGEPTPVTERAAKYPKPLLNDMSKLITKYLELYVRYIGKTIPYVNRGAVLRLMADPMRHYGYERMEQLLDSYIASDDKYFRAEKWNIMTFLSQRTLNKLEQ